MLRFDNDKTVVKTVGPVVKVLMVIVVLVQGPLEEPAEHTEEKRVDGKQNGNDNIRCRHHGISFAISSSRISTTLPPRSNVS
jgi:hypothetical protein